MKRSWINKRFDLNRKPTLYIERANSNGIREDWLRINRSGCETLSLWQLLLLWLWSRVFQFGQWEIYPHNLMVFTLEYSNISSPIDNIRWRNRIFRIKSPESWFSRTSAGKSTFCMQNDTDKVKFRCTADKKVIFSSS